MKLYFIDDDEAPHIYHRLMAEESGISEDQIENFYEVDQAIAKLEGQINAQDLSQWPSYIFVDINMPYKSGYDFVKEVEALIPQELMPVIYFVSSTKNPSDIQKVEAIDIIKGFETKFLESEFFKSLDFQKN